jgi:putative NIF3 family GTP cyclohydrolase 1 type 2
MAYLSELLAFLEARLTLPVMMEDVPLLWRETKGKSRFQRLGLALEFSPAMEKAAGGCDALFLHRPFSFPMAALDGVPILASHLGFDTHLTTGFNPALAGALGLCNIEALFRPDRPDEAVPIGMAGTLPEPLPLQNVQEQITREFGGLDDTSVLEDAAPVTRIAVMNALNPVLAALAAEHGATVYLTGQMRDNARAAARRVGISVLAAGHSRIEYWGLTRLEQEIRQAFPTLETVILKA